ncbi:MAG: FIVAR domain-containing protein [Lachnospiraceae bacterium]|nr:FIVAR domain-containing protein [Lachnospiraceae bacterium]
MKRTISVLLAAAMIVTALPQTSAPVYASEAQDVLGEGSGAAETVGKDKEDNGTGYSGVDVDGNTDSGDTQAPAQVGPEESYAANQTDVEEDESPDGIGSEETEVTDQTDTDDIEVPEEDTDQTASDETLIGGEADAEEVAGAEQPKSGNTVSVLAAEDGETAMVRLNIPRYESNRLLKQVWYAIGDSEEFTQISNKLIIGESAVDIPAKAGEKLQVKLVLRDRVQIEEISYIGSEEGATATPITAKDEENHIYAIENIPSGNGTEPVYQINIKADYHYSLSFVDVYASKNPGAENNKSVAFYQYAKDASGDDEATGKDLIGKTLELSGQEMQKFFSEYNYALEVQEGYTFYSIDANSSAMYFKKDRSYYENGYILSGAYDLGAEDITVFVLAEPTKNNHLKFNIPAELKDKVNITVIEEDPQYGPAGLQSGLEEDDAVWIDSDREVSFDVTIKDMNHTVRVTCEENGGDAVALPYNYRSEQSGGWKNHFVLADADISMKNGDVTVNLEEINIYPVEFHLNPEEIRRIYVYAPIDKSFYCSDDSEPQPYTVWVSEGEQLKFEVHPEYEYNGTLRVSTSEDGSGELHAVWDSGDDYDVENAYIVTPTEPMSIYLAASQGYQYQLDYDESDFDVKVFGKEGEPLELSADHKFVSAEDVQVRFRIMVKMNSEKWTAASVTYDDELDCRREAERRPGYDDEDNGYLCYMAEDVKCNTYGTNVIAIEGYNTHTITFEGNEEAVNQGTWLRQREKDEWDDWERKNDIELGDEIEVKDGEEVYFTLHQTGSTTHRLNLSLSGSGDRLEVYEDEDWDADEYGTLYHFKAVGDATINVELTERQQHTVTIEKSENVTDFQVSGSRQRPEGETGKTGTYLVRDGIFITISEITGDESTTGYRGKVVCTIGEKSYEIPMKYGNWKDNDGYWEYGAYFGLEVTSDMTLTVDLVPTTQPIITFADMDKIASIKVWEAGKKPTEDNLYDSETKKAVLSDDKEYRLDFQLKDGYAAKSVVLKDESSGEERVLERDEESEYRIYEIGVPQGDAQIVIEAVQGYTVMFDIPAGADITFEEDITDYGHDITKDSIQVMATDSFRFRMPDGEGLYKLSVDSDAFTLDKILQREYDYGYLVDEYYQYVLKPVAGAQLPKIVKIKAEEYAKHTVMLDYPMEIKTIYLLDDNGDGYTVSGKKAEVQGTGTVLGVKAISGYAAKVSVQGKTSGESKELTPFRLAEDDVSEYYLGELSEDVTITVTAERSKQKLTYYRVGFYSPGNGVRIRDAGTKALYSANEDHEDWEEDFEYPYSILKGSSISFTVEPRDGYEVDGVYANGKAVTPVLNVSSQQNVYTVVPIADTLITVNISKIAEKYPLTFTYPAAIKSVTVKGFDLTDKKLEVKAGTKLEFTVELADTKHRITSVTMNGKEAAFIKNSGCYSITTVAEPMEIVITTVENIDKEVTFKNTVSHMLYSVVTNAQVTESGNDTYTVAALAGVLRFTVTSAKKESVPAISYVNAAGSKIVLQAKTKQESELTIAYTYEIAVSELAAVSEIVIGETSTASAEDKAKLEECINKYKDKYNQEEYTLESWAAYTKALKAAEDCMKKDGATKAEVEAAITDLEKAVKGLTKKGEEPTPGTKEGLWIKEIPAQTYTGAAIKPEIEVYFGDKLLEVKKDYAVAYKNNTNAGEATVTITGKGNFKDKDTTTFTIEKKDIDAEDISVADVYAIINNKGKVTNPKVTVKFGKKTLKLNSDYAVEYPDIETVKDAAGNDEIVAKDYTIRIITDKVKKDKDGKDVPSTNYTGSREITYTVCANDIKLMSKASITLTAKSVDYADRNNPEKRPAVKTVKFGKVEADLNDFDFIYKDENQAGKATITVTGKDKAKYYGSKSVTYDVKGTKLAGFAIEGINKDGYQYTGSPIYINHEDGGTLVVRPKSGGDALTEGTDYTVSYATGKKAGEHTGAGTVTVMITGINAYTGSMKTTFKITPVDLTKFDMPEGLAGLEFAADEAAKYTKTGAKPEITTLTFNGDDLVEKQDYTLSYQKNSQVKSGEKSATMIIKGKGNFKGQLKRTYEVTIASADDVYATAVDIVKPAKFNQVKSTIKVFEKGTDKALKAGTDYNKNIKYYSDAGCTNEITADNFATEADVDKVIYAKIEMLATGSYAGTSTSGTPGYVRAEFRVYNKDLKMTSNKLVVIVDTTVDKDGNKIECDTSKAKNPYYTGTYIEPKVTVKIKGTGGAADTDLEEKNYRVDYTNNINKGKATITVTGIDGGYGGSKSVKFTIVPKDMHWAEQAVKKAAEALSGLVPVLE